MKTGIGYCKFKFLVCMAVFLSCHLLFSQNITTSVSKNTVGVGEKFQIEFDISNAGPEGFKPPVNLKDFDIYSGPNEGSSVQIINGRMSQSSSMSYVIAGRKEGKFTINPASITTSTGKKESNSVVIEVVKAGSAGGGSSNPLPPGSKSSNGQKAPSGGSYSTDDNLFARTTINKTKAYLGEQITVVHKVYTRLNLRGFQDIKFPSYNGFWSKDAPQKGQIALSTENIDGVNYNVAELKRTYIFPQRSGILEIEPMDISCIVRQRSKQQQTIFDQFFGTGGFEDVVIKAKTKPIKIEVIPLPEQNKPDDFSGAVGTFSFKATLSKNKVKTNEAINLTLSVSGSGNLELIDALKVNIPADIEKYDPKTSDNVAITATGVSGTKSFEYVLIPRHAGNFKIDPVNFSYFNPEKRSYVSISSPEFNITVDKGSEQDNSSPTVYNMEKNDVAIVGNDIRYIKTSNILLSRKGEDFFGSALFYESLFSPILFFAAFILVRRKHLRDNSDLLAVRRRKAKRIAKKRLELAEIHMKENKKEAFYEEIFKALYGYLSDRLTIPFAELTKEGVDVQLKSKNVSEETCKKLAAILDNCEFARYAPSSVSSDLQYAYADATNIILEIEDQLSL
jgi:hypothetical protein